MGIEACREILPDVPMVGVFDTAFHQLCPRKRIFIHYPMNIMKNIKLENMVSRNIP